MPTATPIPVRDEDLAQVTYNADGLVAAIVQEQGTGEVLMLAWMNEATLRQSLEEGRTVFWSRSRQEVWRKGDTSGDRQFIRSASYDCDGDTLLFVTVIVVPVELTVVATCWTIGQSQVSKSTRWVFPLPNFTRGPPSVPSVVARISRVAVTPWATVTAGFSMARSPGASVLSWRTLPWMRPKNVTVLVDWAPLP